MTGYKDPPMSSRFKPGQSGNPDGRPKGRHSFKADLATVVSELIPTDAGPVSSQRLILQRIRNDALRGDANATKVFITLIISQLSDENEDSIELTPDQTELLDDFSNRQDPANLSCKSDGEKRDSDNNPANDTDGDKK